MMAAYDGWGYPGRRPRSWGRLPDYERGWGSDRRGWRLPDWWGDPHDPRYAGFELPRRYQRERYDARPAAPSHGREWPAGQAPEYSRYGRAATDAEVRDAVRRKLFEDTSLRADRIDVEVNDCIVVLSGTVGDYLEARYAWDDAWETQGVEGVISRITVDAEGQSPGGGGE
jgi:hypothetical protein